MSSSRRALVFLRMPPQIAAELEQKCDGTHDHLKLKGGDKTVRAQVYPEELCRAVCRGAAREKEYRDQGLYCLGSVDVCNEAHRPRYGGEHEEDGTTMDEILEIANSWGGAQRMARDFMIMSPGAPLRQRGC